MGKKSGFKNFHNNKKNVHLTLQIELRPKINCVTICINQKKTEQHQNKFVLNESNHDISYKNFW